MAPLLPPTHPITLPALLERALERDSGKTWLLTDTGDWTYERAHAKIAAVAAALHDLGLRRGDVCMVAARNTFEHVVLPFATARLGAMLLAANPKGTTTELAGLVSQARPKLFVVDLDTSPAAPEAVAVSGRDTRVVETPSLFVEPGATPPPDRAVAGEPAFLVPTSGTTGRSKIVMHSQRTYVLAGEGFAHWMGVGADDRMLTALPLFHVNAMMYSVMGSVAATASLAILERFSASGFFASARNFKATQFNAIGAMLEILMRQPERDDDTNHSLRQCYSVPTLSRERHLEIEQRFGFELKSGYALSESPYGLVWRPGERPYGTMGSARQHPTLGHINDVRIVDGAETGEIEVRNPATMLGYFEMPEETSAVLVDGWLRTGDVAHDNGDGTYTFVARQKEVIRRRGENVSPVEIEDALKSHPAVLDAAIVGVVADLSDEEIKAFVVPANGEVDPAELSAWVGSQLSAFKAPRYVEIVAELPYTPTGRIAKHRLSRTRNDAEWDRELAATPPIRTVS